MLPYHFLSKKMLVKGSCLKNFKGPKTRRRGFHRESHTFPHTKPPYCWNPARKPVDMVNIPLIYKVAYMSGGLFRISEPSTVGGCCFSGWVDCGTLRWKKNTSFHPGGPMICSIVYTPDLFEFAFRFMLVLQTNPPIKTALYHPPPPPNQKKAQVTSFCNPNSKQTPCLLFLLFFLLLLLTKTNKPKPANPVKKKRTQVHHSRAERVLAPSAGNPEPSEVQDQMPEMFCSAGLVCCTNKDPRKTPWRDKKHERKKIGPQKKTHMFQVVSCVLIGQWYSQILQGHGSID